MSEFAKDIKKFNGIYKLAVSHEPTINVGVPVTERLKAFKAILAEELDEIDDIVAAAERGDKPLDILTMLADLLGDIQVYCASEMAKFGLPLDDVLAIIMQSNFSKLGADGKPIYDERGKVMKGPNYWKPEPKIHMLLESLASNETIVGKAVLSDIREAARGAIELATDADGLGNKCLRDDLHDKNMQGACSAGRCQWPDCQPIRK